MLECSIMNNQEFLVLANVSEEAQHSQREISKKSGLSLGSVNLVLKRLAKKGWIKTRSLNGRTLEYILTPKGFEQKLRKTYSFVIRTLEQVGRLEMQIRDILESLEFPETDPVVLIGKGELLTLVKAELSRCGVSFVHTEQAAQTDKIFDKSFVINCTDQTLGMKGEVFLLKEIGEWAPPKLK